MSDQAEDGRTGSARKTEGKAELELESFEAHVPDRTASLSIASKENVRCYSEEGRGRERASLTCPLRMSDNETS